MTTWVYVPLEYQNTMCDPLDLKLELEWVCSQNIQHLYHSYSLGMF